MFAVIWEINLISPLTSNLILPPMFTLSPFYNINFFVLIHPSSQEKTLFPPWYTYNPGLHIFSIHRKSHSILLSNSSTYNLLTYPLSLCESDSILNLLNLSLSDSKWKPDPYTLAVYFSLALSPTSVITSKPMPLSLPAIKYEGKVNISWSSLQPMWHWEQAVVG